MKQTKSPGDIGASLPDKEKPYDDFITIRAPLSIFGPIAALGAALHDAKGNLYDYGMMRNATGTYLNMYFSGDDEVADPFILDKNAAPDTVSIPHPVMLELMRLLCLIAQGWVSTQLHLHCKTAVGNDQ
jgi:hypothetical protein